MPEQEEAPLVPPVHVTAGITILDRRKLTDSLRRSIIGKLSPDESFRYDGERQGFQAWHRSVVESLIEYGFSRQVKTDIESAESPEGDEARWDEFYFESDRAFAFSAISGTLTAEANQLVDQSIRERYNGIMLARHFYKLWGSSNIANVITGLNTLLNLKVPPHENPSSQFAESERIYKAFFPDIPDILKTAFLFRIVDSGKYRDSSGTGIKIMSAAS